VILKEARNYNIITANDSDDDSSYYERWRRIPSTTPVNMEKVVILKDGNAISMSELQEVDSVYILSSDDNALFMLVE
jgi:hypothetical protein